MKKLLKTSKKMLAVFLAVMMTLSVAVVAFAVDADGDCQAAEDGVHEFGEVAKAHMDPNCIERGYDIFECKNCGALMQTNYVPATGHKYNEKDGTKVEATCTQYGGIVYICQNDNCPLTDKKVFITDFSQKPTGHNFSDWKFEEKDDHYVKERICKNCDLVEQEINADTKEVNVYYSVEFANKYVVDTYEKVADGTALPAKYKTISLNEIYVLKGEEAVYPGAMPIREKTVDFRKFTSLGWTKDSVVNNGKDVDFKDGAKNISENTTLYAEYIGVPFEDLDWNIDRYEVSFSKENGTPTTIPQGVMHGKSAQYPFEDPTRDEDAFYTYKFLGWTRGDNAYIFDARNTPIYSSGVLYERFEAVPKNFEVRFCSTDGSVLAIAEGVHYGEPLDVSKIPNDMVVSEYVDEYYNYKFSGGWRLSNGALADLNKFIFPQSCIEKDNVIVLTADYNKQAIQYRFKLTVFDIDGETPAANGYVQVLNSAGQFAAGTRLDENGQVVLSLTYDNPYTINITRNGNVRNFKLVFEGNNIYLKDSYTSVPFFDAPLNGENYAELKVVLEIDNITPGGDIGEHNCICHGILARPWITILNIIYRLFGRKTVCCVDMYERHGDILAYTK